MAIKKGQIVQMQYELKANGEIIESNLEGDPIEITFGKGELLDGLEIRMKDMNVGQTKEITVPSYEAFGDYRDDLTEEVDIKEFDGIDLEIGMILEADGKNGEVYKATVTEVTQEKVTVDYNHPLSGQDLIFKVFIKNIA